ncbi:MAG: Omp28-related outer membrane protein [Flavobacteriales bacterium]|nr:Omp28-related outer membrane protein [Flavobacteriales bacterium]
MRTLYTLLAAAPLSAFGQSLVSTQPELRTALLEDFTGIHCQYCPEGHTVAAAIEASAPDRVVIVGVHAGPYATPGTGEPDFRTQAGTDIDAHFTIAGYPAGVINRHLFNGADDLGRGQWEGAVNEILGLSSPVNLGVESSFDAVSRDLTVNVVAYYTDNSPAGNDFISVLLKESDIIGPQTSTGGNIPNYNHEHVLRAYITPTWGDEVTTTTAGTTVTRTYTYNVPVDFDIAHCEVVAFISEDQSEVYQVREVMADGGTTLLIGGLDGPTTPYAAGTSGSSTAFGATFTNALGADGPFTVTLASTDAPADWSAGFTVMGNAYTGSATVTFANGTPEAIAVDIQPGASAGVATYTLTVASVDEPNAPVLFELMHVISGVTDLVITNPQAEPHDPLYMAGLAAANQAGRAKTSRALFGGFAGAGALGDVNNLYYNVSWTFPSLTDDVVAQLEAFLDGGGNLMIAGQDIGWDQSGDPNAYGTAITQAFYEDYMYADYVADGSTANSSVNFEDNDVVFGGVPNSNINNVFQGNSYPEEITPIAPAVPILRYNNPSKIGGLRVQTATYKLVYFGVGPEQMTTASVGEQMVKLSHDWFYGLVNVEDLDAAFGGSLWPVPADGELNVALEQPVTAWQVIDAAGRSVLSPRTVTATDRLVVNVSGLANGAYSLVVTAADGRRAARSFTVAH